jgi:hypothetical protein
MEEQKPKDVLELVAEAARISAELQELAKQLDDLLEQAKAERERERETTTK